MNNELQPTGDVIRVGDFVVDPRAGELRGEAGPIVLSAQPLHVFLALAERPGEVVSRDELRARLWPADTYVDFEHGLNAIVKRLRDALGDSADAPRYIETIPRRGYRLIAAVRRLDAVGPDPRPAPARGEIPERAATPLTATGAPDRRALEASERLSPPSRRLGALGGAAAAGLLLAGAIYFVGGWRTREVGVDAVATAGGPQPVRFTFDAGVQTDASWAPDGRRIAYAADTDGNFDLFTQTLDGGQPVQVTRSPANETEPAWSPDGGRLVFRSDEGGGGLFTVSVDGGPVRRITNMGFHPAWMPNGRDVAFAGPELQTIYVVRSDGGDLPRRILTDQLAGGTWASFAVHPDGRIGMFGIHPAAGFGFHVSDREHRRLITVSSADALPDAWRSSFARAHWSRRTFGRAHWSRKGDAVFVQAATAGVPTIWRVPVDPVAQTWGLPVQLTTGPAAAEQPAISPDGTRLAFTSVQSATRAWVFPFDADGAGSLGDGRPVTDEDASVRWPFVSQDGSTLYFVEDRPGRPTTRGIRLNVDTGATSVLVDDLVASLVPSPSGRGTSYMLRRPSGAPPLAERHYALAWRDVDGGERLLQPWGPTQVFPTDVRGDDRAILATMRKGADTGPAQLVEWSVSASAADAPARVLFAAPQKEFWQGRYSPDGRWVSFVVLDLTSDAALELGVAPADSREASTWTRIAADHPWPDKPRWSPDGRTIYFLSRGANGFFDLWSVRLDPAGGVPIGRPVLRRRFDSPRWHVDPDNSTCELGIAKGRLVLPMRTVRGSIWLLSTDGRPGRTES